MITRILLAFIAVGLLGVAEAHAEYRQIDLTIFGMDCAPCAHSMTVTVERLQGVESVKVSLNNGRAAIQLRPGNAITMTQIRHSVERNGFTPQHAIISARAEVIATGDRLQLKIVGVNETYDVAGTPHAEDIRQQLRKQTGNTVMIEGIVPAQKDPKTMPAIQVKSVKPAITP